jgi:perosamine synthetase
MVHMKKIPICEPLLNGNESKYVNDCISGNWISAKGKYVERFEKEFSKFCGVKYGVSTTSGTTAMHLALASLGIGQGDEVIIPTFTMIGSVNPIVYCGAKPVFVDSELRTWCMDPKRIEEKITDRTKAIVVVHIYGHPVDMDPILEIAKRHGIKVVEDAAEAHGAEYKGRKTGSLGDIAAFSFYANKIITTGEGGMIVTNNDELAERARLLSDLAHSKERRFLHKHIGFNYRMTNMQAAIGVAQLERIGGLIKRRIKNAELYNSLLKDVDGITLPPNAEWVKNVYWMYSVLIEDNFGITRDELMDKLKAVGIDTRTFFIPMHTQPMFKDSSPSFPVAEDLSRKGINLPSGPVLKEEDIKYVAESIINSR